MQELQYKVFSRRAHKKKGHSGGPSLCQFELTFNCGLHCKHCYTDCYNHSARLKKELNTKQVKLVLDKVYKAGAIWLCFTGGDPLTRADFLDIYSYAKKKGFIIIVFTNAYSMTKEIAASLKKSPPFVIEMTLNAATKDMYENISQVKGSFNRAMKGLDIILSHKLPLKIKTQINKYNLKQIDGIKQFVQAKGLKFQPSVDLYARLNHDTVPCGLRILPQQALSLAPGLNPDCLDKKNKPKPPGFLFNCALGAGIRIDPYGNTFLCNLIRKPSVNILKTDIKPAQEELLSLIKNKFSTDSKCRGCKIRNICLWCPGKAYLETADMEAPIGYYCELAEMSARKLKKEDKKWQSIKLS